MDSISQFLMGSAMGQLVLGPKHQGKGALIGGIAGTLPDLDIIPLMGSSIITQLMHHRGVTHSLLFCIIAPLFFAWLSKRWLHWPISFKRWSVFWGLAFITHTLLDLMTSWGTQIFWPYPAKVSLNALFIIDPLITLPLLIGCCWSRIIKHYRPAAWGVLFTSLYMIFSLTANAYMSHTFRQALTISNHTIQSIIVRPTPFNTLFWGTVAITTDQHLVMGYARLWDSPDSISFSDPIPTHIDRLKPIIHRADVQTLLTITNGFYAVSRIGTDIIIHDARFGTMGGWANSNDHQYVFNYRFNTRTSEWTQDRPKMDRSNQQFQSLFHRIFN